MPDFVYYYMYAIQSTLIHETLTTKGPKKATKWKDSIKPPLSSLLEDTSYQSIPKMEILKQQLLVNRISR